MSRLFQESGAPSSKDRNFFFAITTLARWRLRSSWLLLVMIEIGLISAVTIVCAVPLFTAFAETASLRGLLSVTPASSEITLAINTQGLSSGIESDVEKIFDPLVQNGAGSYFSPNVWSSVQTTGMHVLAPASLRAVAPLNIYATSMTQIQPYLSLVQGNWARENAPQGEIEAMLTPQEAQLLHVSVGTLLSLQGDFFTRRADMLGGTTPDPATRMSVRIAGLFAVKPQETGYLHGETFQPVTNSEGTFSTLLLPEAPLLARFDQIARTAHIDAVFSPLTFQLNWHYRLQVSTLQTAQVDDLNAQLVGLQGSVSRALQAIQNQQNSLTAVFQAPYINQGALYNPAPGSYAIVTVLSDYSSRIALARISLAVLALLILALLIFFVGLLVTLAVERQIEANAMLSSRGASSRQIFWSLFFQGLLLCLCALIIGPLLAALIVSALALRALVSDGQSIVNLLASQPGQVYLSVGGYALATVLLALLTMGLLLRRATGLDVVVLRREAARVTRKPAWMRYYLDVGAAVVALTGYGVSLALGSELRFLDPQTQALVLMPINLIGPVFLLLGGLLLFLRLFPVVLRLGAWFGRRRPGVTTMLALVQMERAPRQSLRTTLLLALASACAIFTLVFSASQVQHAASIATFETGADFSGDLTPALMQSVAQDTNSLRDLTARYQHVPGVLAASVGHVAQGQANNQPIEVRAVDATTFGRTGDWSTVNSAQSLPALMSLLLAQNNADQANGAVPVIIDDTTQVKLGVSVGSYFTVSMDDGSSLYCAVAAIVARIPTVNGSTATADLSGSDYTPPGGVLLDYGSYNFMYMQEQSVQEQNEPNPSLAKVVPLALNHVWLRTRDDAASLASVRAALSSSTLSVNNLYDRRAISSELLADPLYLNILTVLAIGVVTTLLLALVGDLVASWLNVRLRQTSFAVLRALGATPRQIAGMLTWEQGIMYLAALVLGVLSGVILVLTIVPTLVFTDVPLHGAMSQFSDTEFYVIQHIVPVQIVVPGSLDFALVALIAICLLALALMVRTAMRPALSQELRLNRD